MIGCLVPASEVSPSELLATIRQLPTEVSMIHVVINDCDADRRSRLKNVCRNNGATYQELAFHLGKAESIRCGIEYILEHHKSIESILQVDGHLKAAPSQLSTMCSSGTLTDGLVVGNRYGDIIPGSPHRKLLTQLVGYLVESICGIQLIDSVCGYRAYSHRFAAEFLRFSVSFGYAIEIEQVILAGRLGRPVQASSIALEREQAEMTSARKLIENFSTLLAYGRSSLTPDAFRALSFAVSAMSQDQNFALPPAILGVAEQLHFTYIREGEDGERCFQIEAVG